MFRISLNGHEPIVNVDQVEAIEPAIRASDPGRYLIDELPIKPFPSGHTCRGRGVAIKKGDGEVVMEPYPWPDR